jgi:hypothetical protein
MPPLLCSSSVGQPITFLRYSTGRSGERSSGSRGLSLARTCAPPDGAELVRGRLGSPLRFAVGDGHVLGTEVDPECAERQCRTVVATVVQGAAGRAVVHG